MKEPKTFFDHKDEIPGGNDAPSGGYVKKTKDKDPNKRIWIIVALILGAIAGAVIANL